MKTITLSLTAVILALSLVNCDNKDDDISPFYIDGLSEETYPRIDGSTSTEPLQTLIACKLFHIPYAWVNVPFDFRYPYHLMPDAAENNETAMFITDSACYHSGTHPAFENLIRNNTDLILVARTASADELHLADSLDVTMVETPIALDALIFLVNEENTVNSITTQQIKDVYTGNITNWSDLGGPDTAINPYTRERNSGSQELMESLMMKDLEMHEFPDMMIYGMIGLINILEWDQQGLGYSVYYYTQKMIRSDKIKLLKVDDITPDYSNIKSGKYSYTAEVYAIIRDDLDVNSTAYKLYQLLTTEAGQRVVKESGYDSVLLGGIV